MGAANGFPGRPAAQGSRPQCEPRHEPGTVDRLVAIAGIQIACGDIVVRGRARADRGLRVDAIVTIRDGEGGTYRSELRRKEQAQPGQPLHG